MPEHEPAAAQRALFFHLLDAFCFVGGAFVAAVAFEAARRRRRRPSEIAGLLGYTVCDHVVTTERIRKHLHL